MDHLAILSKKRKILEKIINGEKTIESRWYKCKRAPYGTIKENDVIYFKESGGPVSAKANVNKVLIYENLNPKLIESIILEYGSQIGIDKSFIDEVKDKKYCILVFLRNVQKINPFNIDKGGYGIMCAWISVDDINKIKR